MVYSGTEFLTSDDDTVALKDLLAYIQKNIDLKDIYNDLKRINELKLELDALNQAAQISIKNLDKKLDLHEHPQIELPDTYTKVETAVLLEKLKGQLKKQIETLPQVTQNDLQGVVNLLRTDLEKAIKAIPKEKPSTTIIEQKLDDKRIDALEKQQKEVLAVIDGVIDNAADELKEVQEKLMKELEKRIKEKNKKVTIIGGVSAGKDNLRELLDVAITAPTNNDIIQYNSTTRKWENIPLDLSGYVPYTGATSTVNLNAQNLRGVGNIGLYTGDGYDGSTYLYWDGSAYVFLDQYENQANIKVNGASFWDVMNSSYRTLAVGSNGASELEYKDEFGSYLPIHMGATWVNDQFGGGAFGIMDYYDGNFRFNDNVGNASPIFHASSYFYDSAQGGHGLIQLEDEGYNFYTSSFGYAALTVGTVYAGGNIYAPNGAASLPSYTFQNDANTGMFNISADVLGFSAGGVERFRVFNGAVESAGQVRGAGGSATTPTFVGSNDTNTGLFFLGSDVLGIATAGTERARFNAAGQFGLGVSPVALLHQHLTTATAHYHKFTNSSTGATATDGFDVGISTTGVAELRQRENLAMQFFTNNINFMSLAANEPTLTLDSQGSNSANAGKIIYRTSGGAESFTETFDASANQFNWLYGANNVLKMSDTTALSYSMGHNCSYSITGTATKAVATGQNATATLATAQTRAYAAGIDCAASGSNSVAIGVQNSGGGQNIGFNNTMSFGTGIGKNNVGSGFSLGAGCTSGSSGVAIGASSRAQGLYSFTVGSNCNLSVVDNTYACTIGLFNETEGYLGMSIGQGVKGRGSQAFVLGKGATIDYGASNAFFMCYTTGSTITMTDSDRMRIQYESAYLDLDVNRLSLTTPVKMKNYTVATLPTGQAGDRAFVTDALAPTWGAAVAGGGAVGVPVYHDGTSWNVG